MPRFSLVFSLRKGFWKKQRWPSSAVKVSFKSCGVDRAVTREILTFAKIKHRNMLYFCTEDQVSLLRKYACLLLALSNPCWIQATLVFGNADSIKKNFYFSQMSHAKHEHLASKRLIASLKSNRLPWNLVRVVIPCYNCRPPFEKNISELLFTKKGRPLHQKFWCFSLTFWKNAASFFQNVTSASICST